MCEPSCLLLNQTRRRFTKKCQTTPLFSLDLFSFGKCKFLESSLLILLLLSAALDLRCRVQAFSSCSWGCALPMCRGSRHTSLRGCSSRPQQLPCGLSRHGKQAPEFRLSIWGAKAELLHRSEIFPDPGPGPVSPVSAGGFTAAGPPEKSYCCHSKTNTCEISVVILML